MSRDDSNGAALLVANIVFFLEHSQLLLASREVSLRGGSILLRWHMIKHDDVPLLQVKTIQMVKRVLGLLFPYG